MEYGKALYKSYLFPEAICIISSSLHHDKVVQEEEDCFMARKSEQWLLNWEMSFKVKNYEKALNNQFTLTVERVGLVSGGLGIAQLFISKILSPRNYYSNF